MRDAYQRVLTGKLQLKSAEKKIVESISQKGIRAKCYKTKKKPLEGGL